MSFQQRFGGAINLNVHFHVLAIDGLYAQGEGDAAPRFHRLPALSELDVVELEQALVAKIVALCHRRGWVVEGAEAGGEGSLSEAAGAASIAGRVASVRGGGGPCVGGERYRSFCWTRTRGR